MYRERDIDIIYVYIYIYVYVLCTRTHSFAGLWLFPSIRRLALGAEAGEVQAFELPPDADTLIALQNSCLDVVMVFVSRVRLQETVECEKAA